jgi:hypothetical protein
MPRSLLTTVLPSTRQSPAVAWMPWASKSLGLKMSAVIAEAIPDARKILRDEQFLFMNFFLLVWIAELVQLLAHFEILATETYR